MRDTGINYWTNIKSEEEAKAKIIAGGEFNSSTDSDIGLILKHLQPMPEDILIDFGCGIGRLMKPLSHHVKQIIGLDVSEETINYGLKYCDGLKNVMFKPMQSEHMIGLSDEEMVDKIYSFLVLQHISKSKVLSLLYEFGRILKTDGKVLLQFPNLYKNENEYLSYLQTRMSLGMLTPRMNFYTKKELDIIFSYTNLKIEEIIEQGSDFYVLAIKNSQSVIQGAIASQPFLKK